MGNLEPLVAPLDRVGQFYSWIRHNRGPGSSHILMG